VLRIENLTKSYGSQVLFEDVTVSLGKGERVGLVGRNGHGKTTLLRLIMGEESPDRGVVGTPKGYRIGHLTQELQFSKPTILKEVSQGLKPDQVWRAEKILAGLGFFEKELGRPPEAFSGGFQVRLNLARLLVSDFDLLLLDEPTNFLDVVSIRWLEKFFLSWKGELILVTHDRSFMDTVTTHIMGIHRTGIRKIQGNTGKYYSQIRLEEEVHERSRINIERKRRQTEDFIRKFRAKARLVGLVQSRIRTLEKQKVPEKLQAIHSLDFSFKAAPFRAKVVMETEGLAFRWAAGEADLFQDLRLTVAAGDRIGVVGPNGKGKSTLLKVLAGELEPRSGERKIHDRTRIGFFGQTNVEHLEKNRNVVEELAAADPDHSLQKARAVAGAMMFEGDAALKKIAVLSGGEKSRVLLGRLLLEPHNALLLDEPTNHLDMDAAEALLEALEDFEGAVVIATHNEMFLRRLAQKLVVFDREGVFLFDGPYDRFLEKIGWAGERDPEKKGEGKDPSQGTDPAPETAREGKSSAQSMSRQERARLVQERSRQLTPVSRECSRLEGRIAELEERIEKVSDLLVGASGEKDAKKITGLSMELHDLNREVEICYEDLVETSERLEKLKKEWEEKTGEGQARNGQ